MNENEEKIYNLIGSAMPGSVNALLALRHGLTEDQVRQAVAGLYLLGKVDHYYAPDEWGTNTEMVSYIAPPPEPVYVWVLFETPYEDPSAIYQTAESAMAQFPLEDWSQNDDGWESLHHEVIRYELKP